MTRSTRLFLFAVVALLALAGGYFARLWLGADTPPQDAGAVLLATRLNDPAGVPQPMAQWQGKVLVVNFWATWCPPCEREMPAIAQFAREHPDVNILSVNIGETADVVAPWLEDREIYGFPVLLDLDTAVSANYGAINIPVTYGLDTDGVVQLQHYGEITIDDLEALVESLNSD